MSGYTFKFDGDGLEKILKQDVAPQINEAAATMAAAIRGMGIRVGDRDGGPAEYALPVTSRTFVTDRFGVAVSLAHPSGKAVQAKHGALTKGASAAGLSVRSKG